VGPHFLISERGAQINVEIKNIMKHSNGKWLLKNIDAVLFLCSILMGKDAKGRAKLDGGQAC